MHVSRVRACYRGRVDSVTAVRMVERCESTRLRRGSSSTGKTFRLRIDFRFDASEDNRSPENELDLCPIDFRKQSTGDNAQIERERVRKWIRAQCESRYLSNKSHHCWSIGRWQRLLFNRLIIEIWLFHSYARRCSFVITRISSGRRSRFFAVEECIEFDFIPITDEHFKLSRVSSRKCSWILLSTMNSSQYWSESTMAAINLALWRHLSKEKRSYVPFVRFSATSLAVLVETRVTNGTVGQSRSNRRLWKSHYHRRWAWKRW